MKKHTSAALCAAFPHTIPVLTGYAFLGVTYGILLSARGFGPLWALASSFFVYSGSMQYLSLTLFAAVFDPL
ncbi:MAG: AzlC family ABC transporter permease, partial [Pygmaiobacter sp.]